MLAATMAMAMLLCLSSATSSHAATATISPNVGCPTANVTGANSGGVLTFRRNTINTGYDAPVQQVTAGGGDKVAISAGESCGAGVSAGDLDGDADADVVFGCQSYSTDRGRTIVQDAAGAQTALYGTGTAAANYTHQCGGNIVTADVNGDGDGDIVVGCHGSVVGGGWGGALLVYNSDGAGGYAAPIKLDRGGSAGGTHYCGRSIAVGDLDGDGRSDIAAGCSGAERVLVFWNPVSPGTHGAFTSAGITTLTPPISGGCGSSIAVGDVTGDRRNDLVTGCPTYNSNRGAVLAWTRRIDGTGFATTPTQFDRPAAPTNATCGQGVAVGDVDRDGRGQIVFGCGTDDAFTTGSDNGAVVVVNGTVPAAVLQRTSPTNSDGCGKSVATGDFNDDGLTDMVVGCWTRGTTQRGSVAVFLRDAANAGFETPIDLVSPVVANYDKCGHDVAAGDVNGDGHDDIVVGCPGDRWAGVNQGGSGVVFERDAANTGFTAGTALRPTGIEANDQCGWSVVAGDIDGDGRADVALGCVGDEVAGGTANTGAVVVYRRNENNSGFASGEFITRAGAATNDECGASIDIDDIDADGDGDLAFGCSSIGGGGISVHLFDPVDDTFGPGSFVAGTLDGWCGTDVALGDANGDGTLDLLSGCEGDGGANRYGSVFVALRNVGNNGFDSPTYFTDGTPSAFEYCGTSVAFGDVNGDGRDDVGYGCSFDGDTSTAGSLVVVTRNAANNGYDPAVIVDHPSFVAQTSNCGVGLALGDMDGDGRSDVVAGCQSYKGSQDVDQASYAGVIKQGGVLVASSISDGLVSGASTLVQTHKLNQQAETVQSVQVNVSRIANGAAAPTITASPNGGATWETLTAGVQHSFTATGSDLRLRFGLPTGSGGNMVQLVHGLTVDYTTAVAPTGSQTTRVPLRIDRSDIGASTATWDEQQGVLRQKRAYAAARFSTEIVRTRATPGSNQYCGWSTETGDFNGDGLSDLVMGCSANTTGSLHAIVHLRNVSGGFDAPIELLDPTPAASDSCAYSLAVGRVNADALDDVVMGCPGVDATGPSRTNAGSAVLFLSTGSGFDPGIEYIHALVAANDQCGFDVALGDFDGVSVHPAWSRVDRCGRRGLDDGDRRQQRSAGLPIARRRPELGMGHAV